MKKLFSIFLAAAALTSCAQREGLEVERLDDLLDVTFQADASSSESDSKIWTGWSGGYNLMLWSTSDAIGLFAGSGNVNRCFTLSSTANQPTGSFSGQMSKVTSPATLYAYYPYSQDATLTCVPMPDISDQVFEGTFEEQGQFSNFGKYAFLIGGCSDFTIDQTWPSSKTVGFTSLVGVVRFALSSSLGNPIRVRKVGMISENFSFVNYTQLDFTTSIVKGYKTSELSTEISDKNPLTLDSDGTKYVQMVSSKSDFSEETIKVVVYCIDDTGRSCRFEIPKNVNSAKNLSFGKRASVTAPISSSTTCTYASRIKVTTTASAQSLTAPVFVFGNDYDAADAYWGDSTIDKYEAGKPHTFTSYGEHSASFNHWGESGAVSIEKLTGIKAIDFSDTY